MLKLNGLLRCVYNDDNPNKRTMKRLILFSMVCLMTTIFERLTFQADGTLTGMRKWQTHKPATIDGEQRYTDWEDVELSGTFTGTWQLRYWSPEGNSGEKRNCLQLTATYDDAERDYMAYSCALTFAYADKTALRIQGYYVKAPDGWINYQRGPSEPSF